MKRFIPRLLWILPVPLLVMGINYFVDPANIFRKGAYESGIADYLVKGFNVSNVGNYDERLLQKYYIERMKECPGTVIMGSSRVMQIGRSFFNDKSVMNNGVSGASFEDFLAIYHLYKKKGYDIKKVLIGLEPYFLNKNNDQARWKVLSGDYNSCMSDIGLEPDTSDIEIMESKYSKYKELWSLSYFKNSLNNLFRGVNSNYAPVKTDINRDLTKLSDGSITYSEESRNSSRQVINGYANASINENPMYSMRDFKKLSEGNQTIFIKFIEYLQSRDVKVEFIILPYHPIVYNYCKVNQYYHTVFDAEKYYYQTAKTHNIHIFGSYNPDEGNYTDTSFYDGFHCKESTLMDVIGKSGIND